MELSEIRTRVRYLIRETTANVWTDQEITDLINLAQRFVALRLDAKYLPQLIQSSDLSFTGVNQNLPSSFLKAAGDPINSSTGDIYPLKTIKEGFEIKAQNLDSDSIFASRIVSWIQDNDLYLSKSVTGTIVMPYVIIPTDLSDNDDPSEIEDGVIDLVIKKAASDALIKTRQLQDSNLLMKEIESRIENMNRGG